MADWSTDRVSSLIDLYEERPCLYNTKHKDYFNRDTRSKSLLEISEVIGLEGKIDCTNRLHIIIDSYQKT